jgi:hypothetical protein
MQKKICRKCGIEKETIEFHSSTRGMFGVRGSCKECTRNCEYISGICNGRIEAHHWDYTKALIVTWFCKKHHMLADNVKRLIDKKLNLITQ